MKARLASLPFCSATSRNSGASCVQATVRVAPDPSSSSKAETWARHSSVCTASGADRPSASASRSPSISMVRWQLQTSSRWLWAGAGIASPWWRFSDRCLVGGEPPAKSLYSGFSPHVRGASGPEDRERKRPHGPSVVHHAGRRHCPRQNRPSLAGACLAAGQRVPECARGFANGGSCAGRKHPYTIMPPPWPSSCTPRRPSATRPIWRPASPLVYVVLRETSDSASPMQVAVVTASPYDAEVYGYDWAARSSARSPCPSR